MLANKRCDTDTARRVVITAGGTGGHVFPALAVAQWLEQQGVDVHWVGTQRGIEARVVPANNIPLQVIDVAGIRGKGLSKKVFGLLGILKATVQALRCLHQLKPAGVLGLGGYVTGPVGVAAWLLRIPLVIHEQNAVAGMTNRLLANLSRRVLAAFPGAFPKAADQAGRPAKCRVTGNPIRETITRIRSPAERMGHRGGPIRILIVGGSLGAQAINEVMPDALKALLIRCRQAQTSTLDPASQPLSQLDSAEDAFDIDVWHQCGERTLAATCDAYGDKQAQYKIEAFIDNMAAAYEWADLVICRAGALTVSEVAAAGLAAIFIPFPHAVDDHQTHNARCLVDEKAALIVPQHELTADRLVELLVPLVMDRASLMAMAQRGRAIAKQDATAVVAQQFLEVSLLEVN